jgi:hypothetical protein
VIVPITVAARDEAACLPGCVGSLQRAMAYAEARSALRFALCVVCDDCVDDSELVARGLGVEVRTSSGGKVEAQRVGVRPGPFQVFCDADVVVSEDALWAVCEALLTRPEVEVASPERVPARPRRRTPVAWALYVYNLRRGFSSQRTWFNGRFFAIRRWDVPTREAAQARARELPADPFLRLEDGLQADDIWLSRRIAAEAGAAGFATTAGAVWYRPPETLSGMYRTWHRLRRELERTTALFPETAAAHATFGARRPDLLAAAPVAERAAWWLFQALLVGCDLRYRGERWAARRWGWATPRWPRVDEAHVPLDPAGSP